MDSGELDGQDDLAGLGELHGVLEEVGEHLGDPHRVTGQALRQLGVDAPGEGQSLLSRQRNAPLDRFLYDDPQADCVLLQLDLAGLDPGEVEDVADQSQQPFPGVDDHLREPVLLGVHLGLAEQLGRGEQAGQRRTHLVTDVRQEQGLGHARLLRHSPGALELAAKLVALGDVLCDPVDSHHLVADDNRHRGDAEVDHATLLVHHARLELLRTPVHDLLEGRRDPGNLLLVEHVDEVHASELGLRVAAQLHRHRIGVDEPALEVERERGMRVVGEQRAVALAVLDEGSLGCGRVIDVHARPTRAQPCKDFEPPETPNGTHAARTCG